MHPPPLNLPRWRTRLLVLIATGICGCSVGPRYQRPDVPPPSRWQTQVTTAPGIDADSVWPSGQWWQGFGSPTLNSLIADAQTRNDDLGAAMARVQEADAQVRIAGATLLPSLDGAASATRERAQSTPGVARIGNVFNADVSATYELDFWGKNRATRAAARATAVASRFDQQTVALTVVSSVANTYFQALSLGDRIEVADDNLVNGEKILHGIRLQAQAGIATGLDVAQQETAVALLKASIPPLKQQLQQTIYALAVLLGKNPADVPVDNGSLSALTTPTIGAGMPSQLLMRRPDVAEAEQQLVAANANITVARAALFPTIQLTAGGGYLSSDLASLISPANRVFSVAAGLTQPIFHGGALRGELALSNARYAELLSTYHKTVITAFSNVEGALVATQQTTEQQARQEDAVAKARRAYEFAQKQMSAGVVNILTVLNTEDALFSAQDELVQIQYLHLQALVNLFTALGGGWQQG